MDLCSARVIGLLETRIVGRVNEVRSVSERWGTALVGEGSADVSVRGGLLTDYSDLER